MSQEVIYIIIAFCLSLVCGVATIPQIIRFCNLKKIYDMPDLRKIHKRSIPRLGGICFLPSMLLAFLIATSIHSHTMNGQHLQFSLWSVYFLVSLMLIYAVGTIDDLTGVGPKTKFAFQIVAASLLPLSGLYINDLYGLFGIHALPPVVGTPLTILAIVYIVNSINLIDGIDGLSTSITFIALAGFLYSFMRADMLIYGIMIAGLMGVLVPFFYFNVWGSEEKKQKIFMGDAGSLTLGFILAFLLVKVTMNNPQSMPFSQQSMLLGYTLLIVPLFDVARVSLVRLSHGHPMFKADKNHIHHKLLRTGLSQHQVLGVVVCTVLGYVALNLALDSLGASLTVILIVDVAVWLLFHQVTNKAIVRRGNTVYSE